MHIKEDREWTEGYLKVHLKGTVKNWEFMQIWQLPQDVQ